jgi:predicted small secreted protein
MSKTLKMVALLMLAASLGACNTIQGMGQDLQNLGSAIEKKTSNSSPSNDTKSESSGAVVTPVK